MPIVRDPKNKDNPFVRVSSSLVRDDGLTLEDKGLMLCLLSLPDDWDFSEMGLVHALSVGRSKLRSALSRLEKLGYVERGPQVRDKTTNRFLPREWTVYETPRIRKSHAGNSIMPGGSASENPLSENPLSENRTVYTIDNRVSSTEEAASYPFSEEVAQPRETPIVDTETEWVASMEACRSCGSIGLLTNGVSYKCCACDQEYASFRDLYGAPGYELY